MNDFDRTARILARVEELAAISDDAHCITRTFGSPAFLRGRDVVCRWMQQAGLQTRVDQVGNLRGKLASNDVAEKTFLIASHIDTVVNAGRFDGPLGVIMGIELLETLARSGTSLPFNIELLAFSDEEGVRFHTTFLGSRSVAGALDKNVLDKTDGNGVSLREAIIQMGGHPEKLDEDAIRPEGLLGYFEIHIEQGPVLYDSGFPAAAVSAIAAQSRFEISFTGEAGHAGTVPMHKRKDALCAAAEFVLATENLALNQEQSLVATVGKLEVIHPSTNVIPGHVVCSLDARSEDEAFLQIATNKIRQIGEAISIKRNIVFKWKPVQHTAPVRCNDTLNQLLDQSIRECGYRSAPLVSGAGHDAVPMSGITPVCMMFVRCFKGISHNPLENVELKDIEASLRIAGRFLHHVIEKHKR